MVSGFLVHFLLSGLVSVIVVLAIFFWINGRSSKLDTRSYDDDFNAGDMMSRYIVDKPDVEPDPYKALDAYKLRTTKQRPEPKHDAEPLVEPEPDSPPGEATSLDEIIDSALNSDKPDED